jgi:hypothetical protein
MQTGQMVAVMAATRPSGGRPAARRLAVGGGQTHVREFQIENLKNGVGLTSYSVLSFLLLLVLVLLVSLAGGSNDPDAAGQPRPRSRPARSTRSWKPGSAA